MGKWLFITILLVVFSGFTPAGRQLCTTRQAGKEVKSADVRQAVFQGSTTSLRSGLACQPLPKLIPGQLVVPEAGYHTVSSQPLPGSCQFAGPGQYVLLLSDLPVSPRESIPGDHFDYLFPFFHFW